MKSNVSYPSDSEKLIQVIEKNRKHVKKKDLKFFEKVCGIPTNLPGCSKEHLDDIMFFMIQLGAIQLVQYNLVSHVPHVGDFIKKENNKFTFHAFNNTRTFGNSPGSSYFEIKPKYMSQIDLSRLQREDKSTSVHYIF